MAEEREYMRDIERYTNTLSKLTAKHLIKKLPEIERQRALEISVKDAFGDEIESSLATIRLELGREWTQKELVEIARKRGISVAKVNQINKERNWKRVVGIDLVQAEPWLADYLGAYALNNAQLISSVGDRYLNEISNIVYQGFTSGTRWEDIAESIAERFGVAESRADLIARDQVNKLNGSITQVRQQALGVDRYTWRTMGDDRVRESHREKDGNIYSWDDPPNDTGHPSEEINCRCYAEPVIDDLLE
jgi:SPP1 gp7 family putative phage head morphogenesis protein